MALNYAWEKFYLAVHSLISDDMLDERLAGAALNLNPLTAEDFPEGELRKRFSDLMRNLEGFRSELPSYTTDAVITYVDKWMWDITLYLLELMVTVREPAQGQLLAVGNSYHTSLTRLSPQEMTDEVLSNIFGPTTAPAKVEPVKDEFKPRGSNFGK
jgi:hypothetical protein